MNANGKNCMSVTFPQTLKSFTIHQKLSLKNPAEDSLIFPCNMSQSVTENTT